MNSSKVAETGSYGGGVVLNVCGRGGGGCSCCLHATRVAMVFPEVRTIGLIDQRLILRSGVATTAIRMPVITP